MHGANGVTGGGGIFFGFEEPAGSGGVPELEVWKVNIDKPVWTNLLVDGLGSTQGTADLPRSSSDAGESKDEVLYMMGRSKPRDLACRILRTTCGTTCSGVTRLMLCTPPTV